VSVVFPAYNEEMYLPLMLWTLSKLNTNIPIEIIGVNNASSDRTWEIIEQSWVKRIDEPRKWVSYARQTWLEVAHWEIVASTDADTQVPETWIDSNMKQFLNNVDLTCFSWGVKFTQAHLLYSLFFKFFWKSQQSGSQEAIRNTWVFSWANMFYKRAMAMELGWYNLWDNLHDDIILAQKLWARGKIITQAGSNLSNSIEVPIVSARRAGDIASVLYLFYDKWKRGKIDFQNLESGLNFRDIR
jgi:glycosyltransferase involved in cell wall biosynthesis